MGQTVDITNIPTVGVSNDPLMNLPLTGPGATYYGSVAGQASLQPGPVWAAYQEAIAAPPGATYVTLPSANISSNIWPWIIGAGFVLILIMGMGRR
jgi:hypothetical protein